MKLAKKELSDIHNDWMEELDKHRKIEIPPDVKAEIIEYIKKGRTNNGEGVVSLERLSRLIKERFKFTVCSTTINKWSKE